VNKARFHASIDRSRTYTGEHCRLLRPYQWNIVGTFAAPALNRTLCSANDEQLVRLNGELDFPFHPAHPLSRSLDLDVLPSSTIGTKMARCKSLNN
jgi:hypothetical protein